MIDLRHTDCEALIASVEDVAFVHADPPWSYDNGRGIGGSGTSGAQDEYSGLPCGTIADHLDSCWDAALADCYLAVWATFPKLADWMAESDGMRWNYITGAAWGKTGRIGMGYHFRGDSEILLLYRKGRPRPLEGSKSNLWLAARLGHSEKPRVALDALVRMAAPPGSLVLDVYAGASASMARVCRRLDRRYAGAEIDEERWKRAQIVLSQQEMFSA